MESPIILYLKRNCLDDGPGIRTTVFFKGCPLCCEWCHNPESKRAAPELSWNNEMCIGCGTCEGECSRNAISKLNAGFIDRAVCDVCFECVDACPSGAMSRLGSRMGLGEIMKTIEKDIPFFRTSGGGVTLSGGEPMLYMDFCVELLKGCRESGVNTLLETCGQFDFGRFYGLVYDLLDEIYIDIKLIDAEEHKRRCGVSNEKILDNIKRLGELAAKGGVPVLPRVPLVSGVTATDGNLAGIAEFLRGCGFSKAALLQYNPLWTKKGGMIGTAGNSEYAGKTWMSKEELDRCRSHFAGFEIEG